MIYCLNPNCQQSQNPDNNQFCQSCNSKLVLKNRYSAIKILNSGVSKKFIATDIIYSDSSLCIINQLHYQKLSDIEKQHYASLFSAIAELGNYCQIPTITERFEQDECFYLIEEFIEGKNLAQILESEGAFSEKEIWQVLYHLLPVLKLVHDRQIIHQDITPDNIIIRSTVTKLDWENIVLVDFSAAKLIKTSRFESENSIGNPEFIAPEQTKGESVFATDLYSLGVTCIYLLTGIRPFDLFDTANNCWIWRDYVTEDVSDRLAQILNKLIQSDLNQRFQSAEEVMQAIGIKSKIQNRKAKIQWQCQHTLIGHSGLFAGVNSVAISPDNQILASASDDKTVCLWDVNTGAAISTLSQHSNFVNSVAFSPDGTILVTGSDDKTIILWQLTGETHTLVGHQSAVKSVAFSPDGQLLASGSWDKTIKLWDLKTKQLIDTLRGHKLQVTAIAFSPDNQILASASFDRSVKLWRWQSQHLVEMSSKNTQPPFGGASGVSLNQTLSGHTGSVLTIAFSPNSKILATGSDDKTIKLWDLETNQPTHQLCGHSWSVVALAFSPDGTTLISGSWDKTVKLWEVSTGQEICTLSGHSDSISAVNVSSTNQLIVSASKDKTIKLWQRVG